MHGWRMYVIYVSRLIMFHLMSCRAIPSAQVVKDRAVVLG